MHIAGTQQAHPTEKQMAQRLGWAILLTIMHAMCIDNAGPLNFHSPTQKRAVARSRSECASISAAASVLAPVLSGVSRLLPHAAYQRTGVLDLICIVASSLQRSLAGIPALTQPREILQ